MKQTRVVIVDDSATSRTLIRRMLNDPSMAIVGEAVDGRSALRLIEARNPDIVLMDVVMPELDGLSVTREIMSSRPVPVVIISELVGKDAGLGFRALEAGALDIMRKPTLTEVVDPERRRRFQRNIRMWAGVPVVTRYKRESAREMQNRPTGNIPLPINPRGGRPISQVCIGASTGGPPALASLLSAIGPGAPWPMFIVQHITPGFIEGLARWLSDTTRVPVEVAGNGVTPLPGRAYLAPDHHHLVFNGRFLALSDAPPSRGHRPAVDALFESVALLPSAAQTIGVLLTGMGEDGARGLLSLRTRGAYTIAQDESSSVVYGMPQAAATMGAAGEVLPLSEIGPTLLRVGKQSLFAPNLKLADMK